MRPVTRWGVGLTVVGVLLVIVGGVLLRDPDLRVTMQALGVSAAATGPVLLVFARMVSHMRTVNRPADEAYEEGRNVGYELGWRDCARANMRAAQLKDRRRVG